MVDVGGEKGCVEGLARVRWRGDAWMRRKGGGDLMARGEDEED